MVIAAIIGRVVRWYLFFDLQSMIIYRDCSFKNPGAEKYLSIFCITNYKDTL